MRAWVDGAQLCPVAHDRPECGGQGDGAVRAARQGLAKARKQQGPLLCEAIGGGRGRGRCQKLRQRVKQLLLVGKHRGLVTRRRRRGRAAIDRMRRSHGQVELGERVGMKEAVRQQGRRHGGDAGWAPCRAGKQPQQWACDAEHRTTDTRCDDDEHAGR